MFDTNAKKCGTAALLVQALALTMYSVSLIHASQSFGLYLVRSSVWLMLGSALIAGSGIIVDKKRLLAIAALISWLPILTLMGMLQGIW